MADMAYDIIQLGRQSDVVTAVAASTRFPGKAQAPELDRSYRNPDEDWGTMSDEQPGRGAYGARGASTRLSADVRFEDIMHLLEMHLAGDVSPSVATGLYTWPYVADETASTTKFYTIELGSEDASDQWRLYGCCADELTLGFDQLSAPGNAPWTADASILALDREIHALTTVAGTPPTQLPAPTILETVEGHLTTLSEGATSEAFASLSEISSSLVMFRVTSSRPYVRRIYGGTTDIATGYGLSGKAGATFEAEVKISSGTKTKIHDTFNASGSPVTEKRWRLRAGGSGSKTLITDARVRYRVVGRGERDGEPVYAIQGSMVRDATLGGRVQVQVQNAITVLP
jgi:hypothetical protein